jgi:DNA-binding PadR family transcriptional regulator
LVEFDIGYSVLMSAPKIRLTAVIMDILDVLTNSPSDDPAWGLRLCEVTGYGTGTVYPALDRLMKAGWITDYWEDPPPEDRPPRRFYEMTSTGREAYQEAVAAREGRRAAWLRPELRPGGTA